jgi:hypothetical protein
LGGTLKVLPKVGRNFKSSARRLGGTLKVLSKVGRYFNVLPESWAEL